MLFTFYYINTKTHNSCKYQLPFKKECLRNIAVGKQFTKNTLMLKNSFFPLSYEGTRTISPASSDGENPTQQPQAALRRRAFPRAQMGLHPTLLCRVTAVSGHLGPSDGHTRDRRATPS